MTIEANHQGEGDRFLVGRIREGDEGAFRQLVDRYTGRLKAYAHRRLGPANPDVEDVLQETFLGIITNISRLDQVRSLEAYLFSILRHKLIDLSRRSPKAHGMVSLPLGKTESRPGVEPAAPGGTPSHYVRQEETGSLRRKVLADILADTLMGLKKEKKFRDLKILELTFYSGWKGKEVAQATGASEPTVTRTKAEALDRLSRLAGRHPQADPSLAIFGPEENPESLLSEIWRENLLSCLKRSTLGAFSLGVLDPVWKDYVSFHLDTVRCETCAANLEDLRAGEVTTKPVRERLFTSSIGFLRRSRPGR